MKTAAQIMDFESHRADKECPQHGHYTAKKITSLPNGMVIWSNCPTCNAELEAMKKREAEETRESLLDKNLESAGILERFREKSFENFLVETQAQKIILAEVRSYCERFAEHRKAGRCLALLGYGGQGKTHLGVSLLRDIVRRGWTALYARELDFFRDMKGTWNGGADKRSAKESEILQRHVSPDLLVLDEVGIQYFTDAEEVLLFQVIENRYGAVKPTVVISNFGKPLADKPRRSEGNRVPRPQVKDVEDALGFRAYDRIMENGGICLEFKGDSYRRREYAA